MNKLRTISDIQNHLDDELGWRIQEIANLKKIIKQVDSIQTRSLLRAGIPILYAHWEGFVKNSSLFFPPTKNSVVINTSSSIKCFDN